MSPAAQRLLYAIHRWGGVALCVVLLMWFVTGIIMMYVGFPKLTQAERLSHLGDLTTVNCCAPLGDAMGHQHKMVDGHMQMPDSVQALVVAGRPIFRFAGHMSVSRADARTGEPLPDVDATEALRIAARYIPGSTGRHEGLIQEDVWTRTMRFAAHRPIHRIQMNDPASTLLYISSRTGEVVRDAPLKERIWSYVGAWTHWLYMFKSQYSDPFWQWVTSIFCVVSILLVLTGVWIGISRWKFSGRYKSGRKTPYPQPMYRWHHIGGLIFAFFTLTWLLSGLASVNLMGMFDRRAPSVDRAAFHGGDLSPDRFALDAATAIGRLGPSFTPRILDWTLIGGDPYIVATDARNQVRVLPADGTSTAVLRRIPEASIRRAAQKIIPGAKLAKIELLTGYDDQYYARAQHTLRGDENRRLPVFRATYTDPTVSTVYIDAHSGEIVAHHDRSTRTYRWLFSFTHSWEFAPLLNTRPSWDAVMLALSGGGLVICVTGLILGFRRVKFTLKKRRPKRRPA